MKRIHSYSGGIGSRTAALRDAKKNGTKDMILLFTDTLIEDVDLYRFMIESAAHLFGIKLNDKLIKKVKDISPVTDMKKRKKQLDYIRKKTMKLIPQFVWISDGRDPWEVFHDVRWIGNSRVAQCSAELKQKTSRKWVKDNFSEEEAMVYVGIDWTEIHRLPAIYEGWSPYKVVNPMCEEPYLDKRQMIKMCQEDGIDTPNLYERGFSHNNCGGFCVRGGQGHFINLLRTDRELYIYHEKKELEMQSYLERDDVTILTRARKGTKESITLQQLREEWENGQGMQIEMEDIGGCGCWV